MNVREKQSLCYYCAARHDTPKNVMFVQSGVETKDLDRTEEAILKELNDMKKGNITDDEILFAKLAMCNSYNAVAIPRHLWRHGISAACCRASSTRRRNMRSVS